MGSFDDRSYPWLLAAEHAAQTLWSPIRAPLLEHFKDRDIAWHDEEEKLYGARPAGPSPNLMDSQVACLNFWWGLAAVSPDALLAVTRTFAPGAIRMVAPAMNGVLVEPEWMGATNHLGERGKRRRGKYATSADALVAWVDAAGERHGALIESKYTESYAVENARYSRWGTDRLPIYAPAAAAPWSPFTREVALEDLMYEPFDQHLRQQLLAAAMESSNELGLRTVRLVHVAPAANRAFHEGITAPALRGRGRTVAEAWCTVLKDPSRYTSVAYEQLFESAANRLDTAAWVWMCRARYGWAS